MRIFSHPLWFCLCFVCLLGCSLETDRLQTAVSLPTTPAKLTQAIHKTTATPPQAKKAAKSEPVEPPSPGPNTFFTMPPQRMTVLSLIKQAEYNARTLDSSQFEQTIVVETDSFAQEIVQQCQIDFPDKMYCQTAVSITLNGKKATTSETEVVQQAGQVWMREMGEEEWQEVMTESDVVETRGRQTAVMPDNIIQPAVLSTFMEQPSLDGASRLSGQPVEKVGFELDVEAYVAAILPAETAVLFADATETSSGHGTLWISPADPLIQQAIITMSFEIAAEPLIITTKANYFGFNRPVKIPNPKTDSPSSPRI